MAFLGCSFWGESADKRPILVPSSFSSSSVIPLLLLVLVLLVVAVLKCGFYVVLVQNERPRPTFTVRCFMVFVSWLARTCCIVCLNVFDI